MTHPFFKNPYEALRKSTPSADVLRLSLDAPRDHIFKIRSVLMDYGALQTAQSIFVNYLYLYVCDNKLTVDNREALINHILVLCSRDVRPTTSGPNQAPSGVNDGRPTGPVHQGVQGQTDKPATRVRKQTKRTKKSGKE